MMKRIFAFGLALVLCMCSLAVPAFAAGTAGTGGANYGVATDSTTFNRRPSGDGNNGASGGNFGSTGTTNFYGDIPTADEVLGMNDSNVVTTNDLNNWVDRKGNDLIALVTRGAQIVAVLGFFGALFLIIIGALGDKRTMIGGFVALVISVLVFTAATCAPQIMTAVRGWLVT